ncbi:hypothetical protein IQ16_06109 [Bradyrhizobium huanghuaihaiense]|uniref:Uncharacterized protein n=1 Tax=Bradyrhizobium huanghuaihaiense TaxID=990078 RepID=A0A562R5V8_9BRAD|nr:hypothetical protein IQ16_06109 [Bradyrhizobium huanghuaihaiense]
MLSIMTDTSSGAHDGSRRVFRVFGGAACGGMAQDDEICITVDYAREVSNWFYGAPLAGRRIYVRKIQALATERAKGTLKAHFRTGTWAEENKSNKLALGSERQSAGAMIVFDAGGKAKNTIDVASRQI